MASKDERRTLDFARPAAGGGVVDELLFDVEECAQAWCVLPGGEELRARQHQFALARPLGGRPQAVAGFEFGLKEVGLQPGHRFEVEAGARAARRQPGQRG